MAHITKQEIEKIEENWMTYISLTKKASAEAVGLASSVKEQLAACPASSRVEYIGCYPGGLVAHSLSVLSVLSKMNKALETNLNPASMVLVGLFHDLGKIGINDKPYYLEQSSEWHRNKGMLYTLNPNIKASIGVLSLSWLNKFHVETTSDEIQAILSITDKNLKQESDAFNEPMLAVLLQQAVRISIIQNKGKTSVLD